MANPSNEFYNRRKAIINRPQNVAGIAMTLAVILCWSFSLRLNWLPIRRCAGFAREWITWPCKSKRKYYMWWPDLEHTQKSAKNHSLIISGVRPFWMDITKYLKLCECPYLPSQDTEVGFGLRRVASSRVIGTLCDWSTGIARNLDLLFMLPSLALMNILLQSIRVLKVTAASASWFWGDDKASGPIVQVSWTLPIDWNMTLILSW